MPVGRAPGLLAAPLRARRQWALRQKEGAWLHLGVVRFGLKELWALSRFGFSMGLYNLPTLCVYTYVYIYISLSLSLLYIYIYIYVYIQYLHTYIHTYIHENLWDFLCRDFRTNFHSTQEKKTGAEVLSRLGCLKLQRGQRVLLGALGVGLWAWGSGDQPARRIMRLSRRIPRQPQLRHS